MIKNESLNEKYIVYEYAQKRLKDLISSDLSIDNPLNEIILLTYAIDLNL